MHLILLLALTLPYSSQAKFAGKKLSDFLPAKEAAQAPDHQLGFRPLLGESFSHGIYPLERRGRKHLLFLRTKVTEKVTKASDWRVLDSMPYPELKAQETLFIGDCKNAEGAIDPELIAVGPYPQGEKLFSPREAWRAERKSGKLLPAPAEGLVCGGEFAASQDE